MALPFFDLAELGDVRRLLVQWRKALDTALSWAPLVAPRRLSLSLAAGTQAVPHGLGRVPQGWIAVRPRGAATVHEPTATATTPDRAQYLELTASAAVSVDLWIW